MQPSRRLCLTGALFSNLELRREVFRAAVSYGLVELFAVDDETFTKLTVQFQRLSAAQRMLQDLNDDAGGGAVRFGSLHAAFTPAVLHVGARLIAFSASLAGKAPGSLGVAAGGCPVSSLSTACAFPEELAQLQGKQSLAPLVSILTFPSVLEANLFLERSQASLSQQADSSQDAFVWHLGADAKTEKALAQAPRNISVEEASSRVRQAPLWCVVRKAGVPGSDVELECGILTKKGRPVPVLAKCPTAHIPQRGDFVEAQLTSVADDTCRATIVPSQGKSEGQGSATSATPLAARLMSILQRGGSASTVSAHAALHSLPPPMQLNELCPVTVSSCAHDKICGTATLRAPPADDGSPTAKAAGRELPVEIPSCFIPGASPEHMCVVGEKVTVCVVAAVAIGGSQATLKIIGSLRQIDLERRGQFAVKAHERPAEVNVGEQTRGVPTALWPTSPVGRAWLFRSDRGNCNTVHVLLASPDVTEGKPIEAVVTSRTQHAVILKSLTSHVAQPAAPAPRSSGVEDALRSVFGDSVFGEVESGRKRPRSDEAK